jgi:hypothetical protein
VIDPLTQSLSNRVPKKEKTHMYTIDSIKTIDLHTLATVHGGDGELGWSNLQADVGNQFNTFAQSAGNVFSNTLNRSGQAAGLGTLFNAVSGSSGPDLSAVPLAIGGAGFGFIEGVGKEIFGLKY